MNSQFKTITVPSTREIEKLKDLLYKGKEENYKNFVPPSFDELLKNDRNTILYYCYIHGIYLIPTKELISFIKDVIKIEEDAIEIGSGTGLLGKSLDIICTDSYIQQTEEVKKLYERLGQPIIQYPDFVEKKDAELAVLIYNPKTVIACWVTQKYKPYMEETAQCSVYGVDELYLLSKIDKYVFIGNINIHGTKEILTKKNNYKIYTQKDVPMYSRNDDFYKNIIYVFEKEQS